MKINQITSEIKDLELAIHQSMFKVYRLQNQLINLNKRDIYSQYETGIFRNAYQRLQTKIKRLEAEKQTLFSCFPQYELDFNEFQDEYNEFDVSDHYLQFQLQQSNKSISVLHMKLDNFRKKNRSLSADIQKLQKSTEGLK
jgi:chromosome segregation ATPase